MYFIQGESLRQTLLLRYFGKIQSKRDSIVNGKQPVNPPTASTPITHGPGGVILTRAEMTLAEVQCHLDEEGASNLVVELIMKNPSHAIFLESVELGIALLEGGNPVIQVRCVN